MEVGYAKKEYQAPAVRVVGHCRPDPRAKNPTTPDGFVFLGLILTS